MHGNKTLFLLVFIMLGSCDYPDDSYEENIGADGGSMNPRHDEIDDSKLISRDENSNSAPIKVHSNWGNGGGFTNWFKAERWPDGIVPYCNG